MTSSSSSYPIRDLLTNLETPLGKLVAQAKAFDDLNHSFNKLLDPALSPHCRVGVFENGILTLYAESAAYATRLRYQVPTILSTLRNFSQWANLRSIQVKVQTRVIAPSPLPLVHSEQETALSDASTSNIQNLIDSLDKHAGNEALIASLKKLIRYPASK